MKRLSILFFLFFTACKLSDSYSIASPSGNKCITLVYTRSLLSSDTTFVKLYYGSPITHKDQFALLLWSDMGAFDVNWKSTPLKIRSYLLRENHIPDSLVNFALDLSKEETEDYKKKTGNWVTYDLTWVSDGKYPACNKK